MVHFTDQAADPAAAADIAAGVAVFDGALLVQADQAADAVVAADRPGGVAVADQSGIRAYQAANFVVAADRPGGVAIADQAGIRAYQAANIVLSADAAAEHADMADDGTCLRVADQSDIPGIGQVDIQAADGMALAVQATGEGVVARADGNEASVAPDALAARRAAGIDVCTQHIRGARRHGHQLQLMCIVNSGRILGCQHRIRGAGRAAGIVQAAVHVDQHPVVARCARRGGEVKARETAGRAHLRARQAATGTGGSLAGTVDGPETVLDLVGGGSRADQAADAVATGDDGQTASGEAGVDRARVDADQASNIRLSLHATRGIAVVDAAAIIADQTTDLRIAHYGAGGVAVGDNAIVFRHQSAAARIAADAQRGIAVVDCAPVLTHQAACGIVAPDAASVDADVLDQGFLGGDGEQAAACIAGGVQVELIDRVAESVKHAAEARVAAQWGEARAPVEFPAGGG